MAVRLASTANRIRTRSIRKSYVALINDNATIMQALVRPLCAINALHRGDHVDWIMLQTPVHPRDGDVSTEAGFISL